MKSFTAIALLASVAIAHDHGNGTTAVGVVTETVTAPTTITLACPNGCTVTRPVYSSSSVSCASTVSAKPHPSATGGAPYTNGTTTFKSSAPTGSIPTTSSPSGPAPTTGGANKAMTASGAGLAVALGFAAFFF